MKHPIASTLGLVVLAVFSVVTPAAALVSIEYVSIGDASNAADTQVMNDGTTGYGAVGYVYQIGKYEVTNAQYCEFLNAKGGSNSAGIFNVTIGTTGTYGSNIVQSGSSGSYSYSVSSTYANMPVVGVTWFDAARFANWLGNGQGGGSMETGAYTLNGATSGIITVNAGATVHIPSENEWYKAAYYNGATSTYSLYPNGQNTITTADANFGYVLGGPTDVGYGAASSNGTYGQGGNVFEWNDAVIGTLRGLRGGCWASSVYAYDLVSRSSYNYAPSDESSIVGFRVASVVPIAVWLASKGFPSDTNLLAPLANLGGASLLMAYALNLDPHQSYSSSPLPTAVVVGNRFSYTFYAGNPDVSYLVEASADVIHWSSGGVTLSAPDGNGYSTASVPVSSGLCFFRLAVSH